MKTHLFLIFLLAATCSNAQAVFSFKEIPRDSIETIEKKFISAYDSRKEFTSAFPDGEKEVAEHWIALHTAFQQHLKENNFSYSEDMRVFLRFYFSNEGNIQYVGYNTKLELPKEVMLRFEKHLHTFSEKNSFGMKANVPYVQCGNVTFKNTNSKK